MTPSKITILKQFLFMGLFVILLRVVFQIIFGGFTFEGTQSAVVEGSKLATWVLGFGLLNLLFDFRKILKRSPKFMKNFATALTIALTLTPVMAQNILRVRKATKLRAHRRGVRLVRSVIVPVFTDAIDQAIILADSMDARGFGNPRTLESGAIKLTNLNFSFKKPILNNVSLDVQSGKFVLLTGDTGSGKSTLLRVIQAKLPGAGFVSQFPRHSFVADTVFEELAFSLLQLGLSKETINNRVLEIANQFHLRLGDNPHELSAGWQQRVAIAAAITSGTKLLLLDEPFSALDQAGSKLLEATLRDLKKSGVTVVVAEHRLGQLANLADLTFRIEDGILSKISPKLEVITPGQTKKGEVLAIVGQNGSGKTTYLQQLAESEGVLVPQPASDLLFLNTVAEELGQADRDALAKSGTAQKLLGTFKVKLDLGQNPRDLSEGQKLALAISIQLTKPTSLLLLDEPTLGFDSPNRQALVSLISEIAAIGTKVLVATHDLEFANAVATQIVTIESVRGHVK